MLECLGLSLATLQFLYSGPVCSAAWSSVSRVIALAKLQRETLGDRSEGFDEAMVVLFPISSAQPPQKLWTARLI